MHCLLLVARSDRATRSGQQSAKPTPQRQNVYAPRVSGSAGLLAREVNIASWTCPNIPCYFEMSAPTQKIDVHSQATEVKNVLSDYHSQADRRAASLGSSSRNGRTQSKVAVNSCRQCAKPYLKERHTCAKAVSARTAAQRPSAAPPSDVVAAAEVVDSSQSSPAKGSWSSSEMSRLHNYVSDVTSDSDGSPVARDWSSISVRLDRSAADCHAMCGTQEH